MSPNGGSCLPCKARKYKCDYAKSEPRGAKRGRITKEEYDEEGEGEGSEEELAPPPTKKRVMKKKADLIWVNKEPKGRSAPKLQVAMRKVKGRVRNLEEEVQAIMVVDDEEEEDEDKREKGRQRKPKPKLKPSRTYMRRGQFLFHFLKFTN
jgi:hypothetical protein